MPLILKESGGKKYDPIPAGTHQAVCYRIWDLGTQTSQWGKKRQIRIAWELPEQRMEIEGVDLPKTMSRPFTNSLHKKSILRPFLEGWRGKQFTSDELEGFDLSNIIGVNCMLQVMHKQVGENTYANITAAMPLMSNFKELQPENKPFCWSLEDGTPIPDETPEWIVKIIEESEEWGQEEEDVLANDPVNEIKDNEEDDLPF
jgi:hypothetical protein